MFRRRHKQEDGLSMSHLLDHQPADSPGYTRLYMREPVGRPHAPETVVSVKGGLEHVIHLHGLREFDVPSGSHVRFPDGSELQLNGD